MGKCTFFIDEVDDLAIETMRACCTRSAFVRTLVKDAWNLWCKEHYDMNLDDLNDGQKEALAIRVHRNATPPKDFRGTGRLSEKWASVRQILDDLVSGYAGEYVQIDLPKGITLSHLRSTMYNHMKRCHPHLKLISYPDSKDGATSVWVTAKVRD